MPSENLYRWVFVVLFVAILSISGYFRRKARQSGEAIPRAREGGPAILLRLLFAAPLYLSILAYMLNPRWMAWSALPFPPWLRWLGGAVALAMVPVVYWVFVSIGKNISETYLTKGEHVLVSHGPYRWVRHPLYSAATLAFLGLGLLAANAVMLVMALVMIVAIALLVIPREEAELTGKFGPAYVEYMGRTGRLLPRL
jgi:protein-S-isoprenylcysteine O-methyltransferase Ste14